MEFFFLSVGTPDRFQKQKSPEQDSVNESGGGASGDLSPSSLREDLDHTIRPFRTI